MTRTILAANHYAFLASDEEFDVDPAADQGRGGGIRERAALADGRGDQPPAPGAWVLLRMRERACVGGNYAHVCYGVMWVATPGCWRWLRERRDWDPLN